MANSAATKASGTDHTAGITRKPSKPNKGPGGRHGPAMAMALPWDGPAMGSPRMVNRWDGEPRRVSYEALWDGEVRVEVKDRAAACG